MNTPTLALIAAHPMSLRHSLLALLARLPQIDSIQSVEDTRSLLAIMSVTQPQLVVLDINLMQKDGSSVLAQIKAGAPRACVVVLVDQIEQQQELMVAPADLVLLKGFPAAELFSRVDRLLAQGN